MSIPNFINKQCIKVFMTIWGAKEGEWFSAGDKEYLVIGDKVWERPFSPDQLAVGVMVSNSNASGALRMKFIPMTESIYYYWNVDVSQNEWVLHSRIFSNTEFDKRNVSLNNCFRDKRSAEEFRHSFKEALHIDE